MKINLISKNCLVVLAILAVSSSAFAQNEAYKNTVSASVGLHLLSFIGGNDVDINANDSNAQLSIGSVKATAVPSLQLAYDHGFKKWFSLGAGVTYGKIGIKTTDFDFKSDSNFVKGDVNFGISRTTIQIRPLFHYANTDRLDLYSGIRVGLSIWSLGVSGDFEGKFEDVDEQIDLPGGLRGSVALPNVQVTLLGLRGYLTENIAAGFELNIGSPYYASAQVAYRF